MEYLVIWNILCLLGIFYSQLLYFIISCYILWRFGKLYGHVVYFVAIWCILGMTVRFMLWKFGIYYDSLVYFITIWYIL
jgi:hypothetical protein